MPSLADGVLSIYNANLRYICCQSIILNRFVNQCIYYVCIIPLGLQDLYDFVPFVTLIAAYVIKI